MIKLHNIHKYYHSGEQPLHVLKGIDLHIREGELVSIMGSSGSGKSTLLNILGILDSHDQGDYFLAGREIKNLKEKTAAKLRNELLGFVFQSFQLLGHLSALENVLLPLRLQPNFNYPNAQKRALHLLEKVGLARQAQQTPKVLSGGEQQRVAIARALVTEPKIIFADEPTGNLDGQTAHEIEQLLFDLNRELGTTLVLVTHDTQLAAQCQRHLALVDGQLLEQGGH